MAANNFVIEKLKCRENYDSWRFAVQTYLEHEQLWLCVTGEDKDVEKITKAKAKIILLIDPINYVHVRLSKTAQEAWKALEKAFLDSGLTRKVGLLRKLITTSLEDCVSVEEYVNSIISTAHKLRNIGMDLSDEWVGTILLAGLPDKFKPMIMGIESSGVDITADSIKAKLLQDVQLDNLSSDGTTSTKALYSTSNYRKSRYNKRYPQDISKIRCYNCNKYGHLANSCTDNKHIESNLNQQGSSALLYTSFAVSEIKKDSWYIDSGASSHMSMDASLLRGISNPPTNEVVIANDTRLKVTGVGNLKMKLLVNNSVQDADLTNVLCIPQLCTNLLSVSQMVKNGNRVTFDSNGCTVFNKIHKKVIATATLVGEMYKLDTPDAERVMLSAISSEYDLWHRRLGHLNTNSMKKLRDNENAVSFMDEQISDSCIICLKGKQTRLPFHNSCSQSDNCLDLIHSDICGPIGQKSFGGGKYFLTFVDDYSKKVSVYILSTKTEALNYFKKFKLLSENQTGRKIKILRTDNGTEFCNGDFLRYLSSCGIQHQTTTVYTPEQNGTAERMNRTIVERARCMLFDAELPVDFC